MVKAKSGAWDISEEELEQQQRARARVEAKTSGLNAAPTAGIWSPV